MSHLLDTNICAAHFRRPAGLAHRFFQYGGGLLIPAVVLAELYAGAYNVADPTPLLSTRAHERVVPPAANREGPMKYKVVLHRTDEGISVSVPGLPGCWSEGDTEGEALENIRDAISEYLAAMEDQIRSQEVREVEVAARR